MLVRWTPFSDVGRVHAAMDRFFEPTPARSDSYVWHPAFDVIEAEDKITLTADVPGLTQDRLDIHVEQDVLTIKGERKLERTAAGELYRRYERASGKFERGFRLSPTVDATAIQAELKEGVLTLTLPKRPEAQPRQIKVEVRG